MANVVQIDASTTNARVGAIVAPDTLEADIEPFSRRAHIALTLRVADLIERHDIDNAARLAFVVAMSSPDFGLDAQHAYATAVAAFRSVTVTVALSDRGIGVSIGTERMDLHDALARMPPGRTSSGSGGVWPTLH
jgi:hypothetical protein